MITCPNCKNKYRFERSDLKEYPFMLVHNIQTCPFGLIAYHESESKAKDSAIEHILEKFPWITKDHKYLRK